MADYYQILGISNNASADEVKKAYRKMSRQYHPDIAPADTDAERTANEERFKEISNAYEVLSNPDKRAQFDAGIDPLGSGPQGFGGYGGFSGGGFSGSFGTGAGMFGDIFDTFFGSGGTSGPRSMQEQGDDVLVRQTVSLYEVISGVSRTISINTYSACGICHGMGTANGEEPIVCPKCHGAGQLHVRRNSIIGAVMSVETCNVCRGYGHVISDPCSGCSGEGRVRSKQQVTIDIPIGVQDGMRLRADGSGNAGRLGGASGSLFIEIHYEQHRIYVVDGANLHCMVEVPFSIALLGGTFQIETLDGIQSLQIGHGTNTGDVVTISGKGLPKNRGEKTRRGDILHHIKVIIPKRLDSKSRKLSVEELAARDRKSFHPKPESVQ